MAYINSFSITKNVVITIESIKFIKLETIPTHIKLYLDLGSNLVFNAKMHEIHGSKSNIQETFAFTTRFEKQISNGEFHHNECDLILQKIENGEKSYFGLININLSCYLINAFQSGCNSGIIRNNFNEELAKIKFSINIHRFSEILPESIFDKILRNESNFIIHELDEELNSKSNSSILSIDDEFHSDNGLNETRQSTGNKFPNFTKFQFLELEKEESLVKDYKMLLIENQDLKLKATNLEKYCQELESKLSKISNILESDFNCHLNVLSSKIKESIHTLTIKYQDKIKSNKKENQKRISSALKSLMSLSLGYKKAIFECFEEEISNKSKSNTPININSSKYLIPNQITITDNSSIEIEKNNPHSIILEQLKEYKKMAAIVLNYAFSKGDSETIEIINSCLSK